MAVSGTLNTNSYEGRYYQFAWTATQSAANNRSTISWTLSAVGGTSSWYAERTLILKAVGTTLYSKTARVERYTGQITSGTFHVDHDSNGDANFSVSIQAAVYVSTVNCTKTGSFALTRIARASALTAANGTLGTAQTLTITPANSSYKHKITYTCGSVSGYAAGSSTAYASSNSISWTPPVSLAAQNTTGTSVSVTLYLKTFNGDTQIGSVSKTLTMAIPSSVKPTVSIAVSDPTGYLTTYGGYVQGKSTIKIVATASGSQGSTIKSYSTTANGKTYTTATATTGVVASSGTLTVSTTVKDSRARTASASESITALAYTNPKITKLSAVRCNSDGTPNNSGSYLKAVFSSSVTSLNSKNTATYVLKYKKSTASTYTSVTLSDYTKNYAVSGGSYVFAAEIKSSYDITLTVTDGFTNVSRSTKGKTVTKFWSWLYGGVGWAFGKYAEVENAVEFGMNAIFHENVHGNTIGLAELPAIPANSDLNDYVTTGCYAVRQNVTAATIANIPCAHGGRLIVTSALGTKINESGWTYWKQQYIPYSNEYPTYTRSITRNDNNVLTYGAWVYETLTNLGSCTTLTNAIDSRINTKFPTLHTNAMAQKVLWTGPRYMTADHTANLSELVSSQNTGIVLVWSEYSDGTARDYSFNLTFIPKQYVTTHSGCGVTCIISSTSFNAMATKYVYISDDHITGNTYNNASGTSDSGIKYGNNSYVLRYVWGV